MIIDAHAHLSNTDYGNINLYLEQLKQAGVEQGVVVPGGMLDVRRMTDYITGKSQPDSLIPDNGYVAKCCADNPNILKGYICVDPHAADAAKTLENGFKQGFKGLKLSPMSHQFSFASKAMASLVAICRDYSRPVYTHVLYSPGASTSRFVALAQQYPTVNFILGHMGFGPADMEGLDAAIKLKNFFLETSTGNFLHIKQSVEKAGAEKVIYGSEFPLSHPKAELEKILLLNISDDKKEMILSGNIKGILSPGSEKVNRK